MSTQFEPGNLIDNKYLVEGFLGSGGLGKVYKAKELSLNRTVAIKLIDNLELRQSDDIVHKRFEREAKALSLLLHSNIVRIYRFGFLTNNQAFIVMECAEGESLRTYLERNKYLDCSKAAQIMQSVSQALEYAHKQNIIHRDLKPENIIIKEEASSISLKVLDFGLCKFVENNSNNKNKETTLTETGFLLGTTLYMSPEQCKGNIPDRRSDIYSFGCIFYELISGSPPFMASSVGQLLLKHINTPAPNILQQSPESNFPYLLETIIQKCLNKDPEARYQSFSEIHEQLEELIKLNSQAKFCPQNSQNFFRKKNLKLFNLTLKTRIYLTCITLATVVASYYWLNFTNSGKIFIAVNTEQFCPIDTSNTLLSNILEEFLKSNKLSEAQNFYQTTISAEPFQYWSNSNKIALLSSYQYIFEKYQQKKYIFQNNLLLLSYILDTSQNLARKELLLNSKDQLILEKICNKLLSEKHPNKSWNEIYSVISKYSNSIDLKETRYMLLPRILRIESDLHKGGSFDEIRQISTMGNFQSLAELALASNSYSVFEKYCNSALSFAKKYELLRGELRIRLLLGKYYLSKQKIQFAKEQLNLIEPLIPLTQLRPIDKNKIVELQKAIHGKASQELLTPTAKSSKFRLSEYFAGQEEQENLNKLNKQKKEN